MPRWVGAALLLCAAVMAASEITAWDVWWQLGVGRWILEHGFPEFDPFSYAFPGRVWIEPRWLYCVGSWSLFDAFGANALILAKIGLLLATCVALQTGLPRRSRWAALIGLPLALLAAHERMLVRPEMLSFLALVLTLTALERFRRDGQWRFIAFLPLMQVVWCNAHTLWILGPAVQWIFLFGEAIQRRPARALKRLLAVAVASSALALANPQFFRGLAFPFLLHRELGQGHFFGKAISEFRSPFSELFFAADYRTAVYLIAIVVSALSFAANRRNLSWARLGIWAAFLVLSVQATRNVALFGWVAGLSAALNLAELHADGERFRWLPRAAVICAALFSVVMIPLVASDWLYREQGWSRRFGFGVSDRRLPDRPLQFLRQEQIPGAWIHLLADGGYVLFEGGPGSVYVDGRLEVYGAQKLERVFRMGWTGEGIEAEVQRLDATAVIVRNDQGAQELARTLAADSRWSTIYYDARHQVYLRARPETRALLPRLAIDWSDPPRFELPRSPALAAPDWTEGWWPRVSDDFEGERLGSFFVSIGEYEQARPWLTRAVERWSGDARAALLLGLIHRAQGREQEALALFDAVPDEWFDRADVHETVGRMYLSERRAEQAVSSFVRANELGGFQPARDRMLARAALAAGRYELAQQAVDRLLQGGDDSADSWGLMGILALRRGESASAAESLERALALDPAQPNLRRLLAGAYERLGRAEEARELRERAPG